ncbi:MAG: inositol monophosphatase family protein [Longimicrobiales bacterium]
MTETWREELTEAVEVAEAAGAVTLQHFQAGAAVERKADRSPVTVADREAERVMREMLRERFPRDGVLGEEGGEEAGSSGRRWVLDPIDGTRSFVHGVPLYGVMVALEADGEAVVGVLHFPALEETVSAARGMGCWWNEEPCRVSDRAGLEHALAVTSGDARLKEPGPGAGRGDSGSDPGDGGGPGDTGSDGLPALADATAGLTDDPGLAARITALRRLAGRVGTFRTWGDAYGYALVATGRAEAMLDPVLNIWDAAAVRPVIEEAGGVFTDWAGAARHTSGHVIATNVALGDEVRELVAV